MKTKKVNTQVRYSPFGTGSAITGFAAQAGASTVKVTVQNGELDVTFNEEPIVVGREIITKELVILRKRGGEVLIDARGVCRVSVIFDEVTRTLDVNMNIDDKVKSFKGLLKNAKGEANAITDFENSLFVDFEPYARTSGKINEDFRPNADKWCAVVSDRFKKDCIKDVLMTGLNWSSNYLKESKKMNDAMKKNAFRP